MNSKLSAEKELEIINRYATSPLSKDDLFIFTVTLCDNEVDRDYECFTGEALESLKTLFIGKTGISDHSMRSKDQCARIFHTYIEKGSEKTACGESYTALKARAYMLRNEETASLISEIEGGIKKEVSISCSMAESTCSICGKDMKAHECTHIKGRIYDSKQCFALLSKPTDAYEWSFVAVPAQRKAGVTKSFIKKEEAFLDNPMDIVKSLSPERALTQKEADCLKSYIASLEALAEEAETYKAHLTQEIERLALIAMPKVNFKKFIDSCKSMKASELKDLKDGLEAQVSEKMPVALQLKQSAATPKTENHTAFKI